ncbi:signal peptide peptidase SppA [Aliikangiella sp. IMCC44359]|uniref:signal peptide peptidase SppA n=1 Tax=Aliikangiella sp. IMCC44359 TaxID=3459125 RepID=UPI00403B32E7
MVNLLKSLWYGLDLTRKIILNVLFFSLLLFLISAVLSSGDKVKVENGVALILKPNGYIVEQLTYKDPLEEAMQEATGNEDAPETLLYDLIDAIKNAKDDNRITVLVINTKYLWGAGVTKLQDLAKAIDDFKQSGKKVIAYDDNYSQSQYFLASQADEIYMNPKGGVFLTGFSRVGTYFKSLLDNLEVSMHVFKVGTYKSYVEPFVRDSMSDQAKEANRAWLNDLWHAFTKDISIKRSITQDDIYAYIDSYKESLTEYKGDSAKLALDKGLVDQLATRIQFREKMIEMVGQDQKHKSYKQITHSSYLKAIRGPLPYVNPRSQKVAVIMAKGEIADGERKEGAIGGDTLARIIRKTRHNEKVKAIVLRVDTGGGSAFASEIIREELVKAQDMGIKVVVSMGDMAASGGYWISATADEIWANPTTITGSIGIFGMFPTFEKPLNKFGIHRDGVGTTRYSNPVDIGQPLKQDVADIIQTGVEAGYDQFLELVAKGRGMTKNEVDKIAQGRVWSGKQAHEFGLVDQLGSLDQAVASAAKLANLDNYDTWFVKRELDEKELLLKQLLGNSSVQEKLTSKKQVAKSSLQTQLMQQVSESINELTKWNDPNHTYASCFCSVQ